MPYETFITNITNAHQLIRIARSVEDPNSKQLLYRSTVVLSVAHWQNFNEAVILYYSNLIQQRAASSKNLPNAVRKEVGKWIMRKEATVNHPDKVAKLIWDYADGIWKKHYGEFVQEIVDELNTPNSTKLNELYNSTLGIRAMADLWKSRVTSYSPTEMLDKILTTRHEIAHGSFSGILSENELELYIDALKEMAWVTFTIATDETSKLLETCGTHYTLDSFDLKGLIKWVAEQAEPRVFKVNDMSRINNSWYANHNKLS